MATGEGFTGTAKQYHANVGVCVGLLGGFIQLQDQARVLYVVSFGSVQCDASYVPDLLIQYGLPVHNQPPKII
jgi:hypothetical protein